MEPNETLTGLKQLVKLLEEKQFDLEGCRFSEVRLYLFCETPEKFFKNAKELGNFKKSAGDYLNATRSLGDHVKFEVTIARELVCKKIVSGTRTIPASPEQIIPAKESYTEEIVEYQCPESFIDPKLKTDRTRKGDSEND